VSVLCLSGFRGKSARMAHRAWSAGGYGRGTAFSVVFIEETENAAAPAAGPRNWDSTAANSLIEMLIK